MVFVAGARQVGKTTFARSIPGARAGYLNWDVPADRWPLQVCSKRTSSSLKYSVNAQSLLRPQRKVPP